ncbi:MAG: class I SAM-dependent methyltransferase [Candidatus Taylorbacteria bacterium]|nr:class I SAM-dependent methyltransferase [Candidatus Taylorbacteria bacterium]
MKRSRNSGAGQEFWNKEYRGGNHLALSENPSEDLIKFTRWLERESGKEYLNIKSSVLDLGCGNGRNLIYLSKNFGMRGLGFDISEEAILLAKKLSEDLSIEYQTRSIAGQINIPEKSQNFVLDMMTSHFLNESERKSLLTEISRVLKPGGWFFWKTFLRDEDEHAERLLKESPAGESGSYIHPKIGVAEHVYTENEISKLLDENFDILKITKSHSHLRRGQAFKRRSMSIYAQRKF